MMKWTQAKSTSSDEEVQKSLDLLDRVLSEFEDIEHDLVSDTDDEAEEVETPPPIDRKTKPKHEEEKTKREIYFGTSTVERSLLKGGVKRGVETSVFLQNIGLAPSVEPPGNLSDFSTLDGSAGKPHQQSPLASNEVLTVDATRLKFDTLSSSYTSDDGVNFGKVCEKLVATGAKSRVEYGEVFESRKVHHLQREAVEVKENINRKSFHHPHQQQREVGNCNNSVQVVRESLHHQQRDAVEVKENNNRKSFHHHQQRELVENNSVQVVRETIHHQQQHEYADRNIRETTQLQQSDFPAALQRSDTGDESDEVIDARGALSLWLKRDEEIRNVVPVKLNKRRSLDDGQPGSLPSAKTPPERLPKPTNIVKPISQNQTNIQKRVLQRPVSLMVLNTPDPSSSIKPLSPLYRRPAPQTPEKKGKPPRQISSPSSPISQTEMDAFSIQDARKYELIGNYDKTEFTAKTEKESFSNNHFNYEGRVASRNERNVAADVQKESKRDREEVVRSPLLRQNTYVISRESPSLDYSVRSGSFNEVSPSSSLHSSGKKRPAPKPPVEADSPTPPSIPESGTSLATDQDFREKEVLSDSSTTTEKTTQATQTTLPRKKLSKRSSFTSPAPNEKNTRPDSGMKRRPHSLSPPYSHSEANHSHETYDIVPPPVPTMSYHNQTLMGDPNFFQMANAMEYQRNAGMSARAISHNILANERYYNEQAPTHMSQQYPQFDLTTNPYLLQYSQRFQSQQYIPEVMHQQRRTSENHVLNRMNHAYHMNQRHSINLEHILSLEQLTDPRYLAHSKSFSYGPKPVMGVQARRTQATGTHSLEHPKSRQEQEMLIQVNEDIVLRRNGYVSYPTENIWFKNNLQDSGFEDVLLEKKKFAPVIRDKLQKNTNIYLPSPPSPDPDYSEGELLDRFDNDSLSGDSDRELTRVERIVSDFHKSLPVLDRKVSRDSMYSNDSLDLTEHSGEQTIPNTTLRSEGQWSTASFDYYSPDGTREAQNLTPDSGSEESDKTEKTLISSGEEITTLKRLISEGVIKLDEAPPDFLPPPPPGVKRISSELSLVDNEPRRLKEKSPSVDSGQGSIPTTIRSDQPSYVKSPNKAAKSSKLAQRAVEKDQLKAVKSLDPPVDLSRKSKLGKFGKSKSIEDLSRTEAESPVGGFGIALPKMETEKTSTDSLRRRNLFGRGSPKPVKEEKLKSKKSFGSTTHLAADSAQVKNPKKGFFFSFWKKKQYTLDPL